MMAWREPGQQMESLSREAQPPPQEMKSEGRGARADVLVEETTSLEGIMGGVAVAVGVMRWSGPSLRWRSKSEVSRRRTAWR